VEAAYCLLLGYGVMDSIILFYPFQHGDYCYGKQKKVMVKKKNRDDTYNATQIIRIARMEARINAMLGLIANAPL